jgi:diguanylate cyclase (GGDEF)-like protein
LGYRILVVGRLPEDVRRDLEGLEPGSELLGADGSSSLTSLVSAFAPHVLVLGADHAGARPSLPEGGPPLPVLALGGDDADVLIPRAAGEREPALRAARKLAEMRRAHLTALEDAVDDAEFRRFQEILENEFLRAARYRHPVSLVLTAIDDLDGLVRDHGRSPVRAFVDLLRASLHRTVRQVDLVLRPSHSEIAVLLPETTAGGALVVAERMRVQSRRLLFKPAPVAHRPALPIKITSSVGIADAPREGLRTSAEFLACARQAVLRARSQGGEHAVVHREASIEP